MTVVLVLGWVLAIALALVGAYALMQPHVLARLYGVPVEGHAPAGFVRATGIRDLAIGFALGAAVYFADLPLIVVLAIAGVAVSIADFAIAYHASGRSLGPAHGVHAGGVVAFVLILAMALFAIGR